MMASMDVRPIHAARLGEGVGPEGSALSASAPIRRALVVSHYPVFGGPHNVAMRINAVLAEQGWEVAVLVPDEPGNAEERLRAGGVKVYRIPLHRARNRFDPRLHAAYLFNLPGEVAAIRRILREERFDVLMLGGYLNPHGALAARMEGVALVWQVANVHTFAPLRPLVIGAIERLAGSVMFTGETLRRVYLGGRQGRIPVFPFYPPVDTQRFRPSAATRAETRRQLGIPADVPVVGVVCNLNPQKGMEYFVQAAKIIYLARNDVRFVVVGARMDTHRDYADKIFVAVRESGIPAEQFIFTGARADVENCYPAMDLKLITSLWEGVPNAALEAMSAGLPVVTTDVGALGEVVGDDERGFVVAPRDPQASAAAVLRLLDNNQLRSEMAQRARRHAIERFDMRICAAVHREAFEAALARQSHPAAGGVLRKLP